MKSTATHCNKTTTVVKHLSTQMQIHAIKVAETQRKLVKMEDYSRKNNLLFTGHKENKNEDCLAIIKTFMETNLQIEDYETISIQKCCRLGSFSVTKIRPILVELSNFQDRERVFKSSKILLVKSTTKVVQHFSHETTAKEKHLVLLSKSEKMPKPKPH